MNEEDNLSQSEEFGQVNVDSILPDSRTANYKFDIGLYISGNIPVEKEFRHKHAQLTYHRECCVDCETFKRIAETPGLKI